MSICLAITFLVILIKQSTRYTISSLFAYESLTTTRQKRNCMEKHPLVSMLSWLHMIGLSEAYFRNFINFIESN